MKATGRRWIKRLRRKSGLPVRTAAVIRPIIIKNLVSGAAAGAKAPLPLKDMRIKNRGGRGYGGGSDFNHAGWSAVKNIEFFGRAISIQKCGFGIELGFPTRHPLASCRIVILEFVEFITIGREGI
jgi:hypothetical protein